MLGAALLCLAGILASPVILLALGAVLMRLSGIQSGGSNSTPARLLDCEGIPVSNVWEFYNGRVIPPVVIDGQTPGVIIMVDGVWQEVEE